MTDDPTRDMLIGALTHYDRANEAPGPAMREFEMLLAYGFATRAQAALDEKRKAASQTLDEKVRADLR